MALQVGELAAVRSPEGSGRVIAAARDGEHPVLEEVQTCVWLLSPSSSIQPTWKATSFQSG